MIPCVCGTSPAPHRCAWKLRKPFMIWARDLKVGDRVQVLNTLAYAHVDAIRPAPGSGSVIITTALTGDKYVPLGSPMMVMRPGHCEAPCCDSCAREVGDGVFYCRAHWDASERQDSLDQREEVEA